ncbi:MAG: Maf family nucleotide pyrophosphatase [Schleiferiaceae bacterium]
MEPRSIPKLVTVLPYALNGSLVLGSGSPRRRELLAVLGIPYTVRTSDADESAPAGLSDVETVRYVARAKAEALLADKAPGEVLLTADTEVWFSGIRFGKPRDLDHAVEMLQTLRGQTHKVITAVCATDGSTWSQAESVAEVTFHEVSDEFIRYYVQTFKPLDKAGAYGAQEWFGQLGIAQIVGTFDNVKGLPLDTVVAVLDPWLAKVP